MAAQRNLHRLKNSCERLAQMDTDNKNVGESILSLENCYSFNPSAYEADIKFEKSRFGETRIEKRNRYAEDYRKSQKSLIVRENKVNEKFDELIDNLEQISTQVDDSNNVLQEPTTTSLVPLEKKEEEPKNMTNKQNTCPLTPNMVKSPDRSKIYKRQIKNLNTVVKNLKDRIGKLEEELNKPLSEDEIKEIKSKISVDLGVEDIDKLIKFIKDNDINLSSTLADSIDAENEEEEEEEEAKEEEAKEGSSNAAGN